MLKKIIVLISISPFIAVASSKHSITFGYADSYNASIKGGKIKKELSDGKDNKAEGAALKYRYEWDDKYGVIVSLVVTGAETDYKQGKKKIGSVEYGYKSLLVGPTYRFNDYFSAYAVAGMSKFNLKPSGVFFEGAKENKKTTIGYGAGIQINPVDFVVADISIENAKGGDFKASTVTLGLGYRF